MPPGVDARGAVGAVIGDHAHVEQQFTRVFNLAPAETGDLPPADPSEVAKEVFRRHQRFGGRDEDLARLEQFAETPDPGIFVLTGRSGYGKTALLAHWISRRLETNAPTIFHFLSGIDGFADQPTALTSICRQLAAWHGLRGALPTSTSDLVELYGRLLHMPHAGDPVVVVIDALDEADGWTPSPGHWLVGDRLPDGVHLVVSAREIADTNWIELLGPHHSRVESRKLGGLSPMDTAGVLIAAGKEARRAADDGAFVERLTTIAGGDPYFLKLLAEDVAAGRLSAIGDLDSAAHEGLNEYFACWWRELTHATGDDPRAVRDLLGYMVASEWPIPKRDLVQISADDALDSFTVDRAIEAVQRHLVGNEKHGYALSHARFREHLNHAVFTPDLQAKYRELLLDYCAGWRESRSEFALERLVSLLRSGSRLDELLALVRDPAWEDAKLTLDPSGSSLKRDLEAARAELQRHGFDDSGGAAAGTLVGEIGLAMRLATVVGVSLKVPPMVLRELLLSGAWSEEQVLAVLDEMPDDDRRAQTIEALSPHLSADGAIAAIEIARRLPHRGGRGWSHPRATALVALAKQMNSDEAGEIVAEAFAARTPMDGDSSWLSVVVAPLARLLTRDQIAEALEVLATTPDSSPAVVIAITDALADAIGPEAALRELSALSAEAAAIAAAYLASSLQGPAPDGLVDCACEMPVSGCSDNSPRATALGALADHFPQDALDRAVRAASEIPSPEWQLWAYAHLARAAAPGIAADSLLDEARALKAPAWRANTLAVLAPTSSNSATIAAEALTATLEIKDKEQKLAALREIVPHLADSSLRAAAEAALTLGSPDWVAKGMATLAERLPQEAERREIDSLIGEHVSRLAADGELFGLRELAAGRDEAFLEHLAAAAESEDRPGPRATLLGELAEAAPERLRDELSNRALEAARELPTHEHSVFETSPRANALASLLAAVPTSRSPEVVSEVLSALRTVGDPAERGLLLADLLPDLDGQLRAGTFELLSQLTAIDGPSLPAALMPAARGQEGEQILDAAERLNPSHCVQLVGLAARELRGSARSRARKTVRSMVNDAKADLDRLIQFGEMVPDDLLPLVLSTGRESKIPAFFARVVISLAPRLEQDEFRGALVDLHDVLPTGFVDEDGPVCPREAVLRQLCPWITAVTAAEADQLAAAIEDDFRRIRSQLSIASALPARRREEVVAAAASRLDATLTAFEALNLTIALLPLQSSNDARTTTEVLLEALRVYVDKAPEQALQAIEAAAPLLEGGDAEVALDLLKALPGGDNANRVHAQLCVGLGPRAEPELIDAAVERILQIEDPEMLWRSALELAPIVPGDRRRTLAQAAIGAAMAFDQIGGQMAGEVLARFDLSPEDRCSLLRESLGQPESARPDPPERTLDEAMPSVAGPVPQLETRGFHPGKDWPAFRTRIMPDGRQAIERFERKAVSIVQGDAEIPFYNHRFDQLSGVGRVEIVSEAIGRAWARDPESVVTALAPLAPHLPLDALPSFVNDDSAEQDWIRDLTIELLAPPLPRFFVVRPISHRRRREEARDLDVLQALAPMLGQADDSNGRPLLGDVLDIIAQQPRPYFLIDLRRALRPFPEIGNIEARSLAAEIVEAAETSP